VPGISCCVLDTVVLSMLSYRNHSGLGHADERGKTVGLALSSRVSLRRELLNLKHALLRRARLLGCRCGRRFIPVGIGRLTVFAHVEELQLGKRVRSWCPQPRKGKEESEDQSAAPGSLGARPCARGPLPHGSPSTVPLLAALAPAALCAQTATNPSSAEGGAADSCGFRRCPRPCVQELLSLSVWIVR